MNAILRSTLLAAGLVAGVAQAAEMTVFKQPNFTGDAITLRDDATNLSGHGFQDQISSIVVRSGRWEVCTQPNFQGDCVSLEPGRYTALDARLNHRIESVREVTRYADNDRHFGEKYVYRGGHRYGERRDDRYADNRYADNRYGSDRNWRGPAVELFDGPDFSGRTVRIHGDTQSLYKRGFDDQASSMVVHEGRWQIDLDSQGHATKCLGHEGGSFPHTLYDVLVKKRPLREVISTVRMRSSTSENQHFRNRQPLPDSGVRKPA